MYMYIHLTVNTEQQVSLSLWMKLLSENMKPKRERENRHHSLSEEYGQPILHPLSFSIPFK